MHRVAVGDLEQPLASVVVEVSLQNDSTGELIDPAFLGCAFGTVTSVNLAVSNLHGGAGQREFLAARV